MNTTETLDIETLFEALEVLNDGISIYDPSGTPIFLNQVSRRRFARMYANMDAGLTHRQAIEASVRRNHPEGLPEEIERITEHFAGKFHNGESYLAATDDGREVVISFRHMSRGRKAGLSVDVTELRQRERELEKARKAAEAASHSKSSFLANMSHEIRTPLNGIMGMAQVLEGTNLDQTQRDYLTTILDSSSTLMALLNDVLDLSKIEAGKFDIVATDASLHHVLRRQLKLWKPKADEKGLELQLAFDADLPAHMSFDTVRVQQCVSNLVSNAIKFTKTGSVEVFASAKPLEDGAHLITVKVKDSGPGMDAETLGRLFKAFAQADETIQRAHGGTGLGLSITRRLAELMGGEAGAASVLGQGSVFHVSFRAEPSRSQIVAETTAQPSETGDVREQLKQSNLRVLLVDDHPINRQVAALFLRPFNMRITEAVNGAEAIAALEKSPFDVVLLDMHMPVMDGPTCVSKIRGSSAPWNSIPVIALTADAMSGDRERYLGMGMNGYLSKPLAERDLLSEIARVRTGVLLEARRA